MKQLAVLLTLAAIVAPALADVSITAADLGNQQLQLRVTTTGSSVVRGVALTLNITGGNLAGTNAYITPASAFNTFIDYAFTTGSGYTIGSGHPLATVGAPGVLASFPATQAVVCVGYLDDQGGNQAGLSGTNLVIATLQISGIAQGGSATVAIAADTLRGGVVGDNLGNVTIQSSQTIAGPVPQECVKSTAPFYADWVSFGKPNCWCYARNCRGDADGLAQGSSKTGFSYVDTNDLNILAAAWKVKEAPFGPGVLSVQNGICADFARDAQGSTKTGFARVDTNDLNILAAYWKVKEPTFGPGVPTCGTTYYNFFVNP